MTDELLGELYALRTATDDLIEQGLVQRASVRDMLRSLLPMLCEKAGASGVIIETYGESLSLESFAWPEHLPTSRVEATLALVRESTNQTTTSATICHQGDLTLVALALDVAGTWFGRACLLTPRGTVNERSQRMLHAFCEVLDNYLYTLRAMREKHLVTMQLGNALRHRVLSEGLDEAISVLANAVSFDKLLIAFVAEQGSSEHLHVLAYDGRTRTTATLDRPANSEPDETLHSLARAYIASEHRELLDRHGFGEAQEEVLINGVTKGVVVGKVVAAPKTGSFNTYDRELLAAFAGFVRQRIVDFNKEWRALAASFRPDDISRLLKHDDYEARYLAPREESVAILYVDISGFTRLSETVLRTPAKVAELVEAWSKQAVDIVWRHGGVFDKMVGDCVIALFGPPFYDEEPRKRLQRAIAAAIDIRHMTSELPADPRFATLEEARIGVSTGVNLAQLFVGRFGPNENFTGFSSGMNNTARLQGCAAKNEILVMESAVADLLAESPYEFGPTQSAPVKNVAEPLRYRLLLRTSEAR